MWQSHFGEEKSLYDEKCLWWNFFSGKGSFLERKKFFVVEIGCGWNKLFDEKSLLVRRKVFWGKYIFMRKKKFGQKKSGEKNVDDKNLAKKKFSWKNSFWKKVYG